MSCRFDRFYGSEVRCPNDSSASTGSAGDRARSPAAGWVKARDVFGASFLLPAAERSADRATRLALRLQLGVPVEVVEPALVQIVRREAPAVAVQMIDARLERHLRRPHLGLVQGHVALLEIARRAGGDHVGPSRVPATRARQ